MYLSGLVLKYCFKKTTFFPGLDWLTLFPTSTTCPAVMSSACYAEFKKPSTKSCETTWPEPTLSSSLEDLQTPCPLVTSRPSRSTSSTTTFESPLSLFLKMKSCHLRFTTPYRRCLEGQAASSQESTVMPRHLSVSMLIW